MTNAFKLIKQTLCVVIMLLPFLGISASTRQKLNFNSDWRLHIGDMENGEAVSELSYDIIRYIFKFLTSIGDEVDDLDDEELEECIENGNNKISSLMIEIENMIREICDKLINSYMREIRNINEKFKILELNGELENVKSEFNTMAKKNNLNVTFDDLAKQVEEKKRLEKEAKK